MSHYTKVKTQFKDPELVRDALVAIGYPKEVIELHKDKAVKLIDYLGKTRPEQAHVVIRREHVGPSQNDLGFECGENPQAHICDFARTNRSTHIPAIQKLGGHGDNFLKKLADEYAFAAVARTAKIKGRKLERYDCEKTGKIKVFVAA